MNYYTADPHFSHKNIIKYCNRPFETTAEMDAALVKNFNKVITPKDNLYILGDVGFGNTTEMISFLQQLNGTKILIVGNHDHHHLKNKDFRDCFKSIHDILSIKDNGLDIVLCHYPMLSWDRSFHGSYHFYGHVHNTELEFNPNNAYNVGVDLHGFKPVTAKQIIT